MQVTPWSNALALAPFVLGIAACTGGTLSGKLDAGAPDAGQAEDSGFPIADAGFADTGVDPVDSGIEADAGETPDAGFPDAEPVDAEPTDSGFSLTGASLTPGAQLHATEGHRLRSRLTAVTAVTSTTSTHRLRGGLVPQWP